MRQADILRDYAGRVIVLHERQVLGSGRDHLEALDDARQRVEAAGQSLPERAALLFVAVPETLAFHPLFFAPAERT
jgi:hypothetical protein